MLGLNSEQLTTLMKNKVSQQPTKRGFPCITLIFLTFKTLKHMLPEKENRNTSKAPIIYRKIGLKLRKKKV